MKNLSLLPFLLLLNLLAVDAQTPKVVGYLPYYRFALNDDLQYEQLTHLNLAFLNPDMAGNLDIGGQNIDPIVLKARAVNPNIEVFISLAGGGVTAAWAAAYDHWMQPANLSAFVHILIQYVELHNLDGIDVDLEWSHVNSLYSPFVIELADSLHAKGLEITAAWPATYRYPDISNAALAVFDWINLMAYDLTGPWSPSNPGPHSPYSFAQQGISYWLNQGVSSDRMTLGVPFYGRSWDGTNTGQAFTYGAMVAEDTSYAYLDQVGQRYYNGIPTIQAKTLLAQTQTAGIMIWEIGQDALGALERFSLLNAIDEQMGGPTPLEPSLARHSLQVYPNPFADELHLRLEGHIQGGHVRVLDLQGRILLEEMLQPGQAEANWNLAHISPGMYVLQVRSGSQMLNMQLVKR